MKPGQSTQTAVLVCMARAVAHRTSSEPRFSDATALPLLPADARARVERHLARSSATGLREGAERAFLDRRAKMMIVRTVEIDEAVRGGGHPQVVILGAGLDGRAWRMPELGDAVVYEVDHPDTQRDKKERVGALPQTAREVRFVPVDFARDRLGDAHAASGSFCIRAGAGRLRFPIDEGTCSVRTGRRGVSCRRASRATASCASAPCAR